MQNIDIVKIVNNFKDLAYIEHPYLIVAKERVVPRTTARSYSGIRLSTKKKEKGAVKTTMAKESRWRNVVTTFLRFDSSDHCESFLKILGPLHI